VNFTTKRPVLGANFGEAGLTFDSNGQQRGTIDGNVTALNDTVAVRFAGVYEDSDGWVDRTHLDKEGCFGSVLVKPIKGMFVRFDLESMETTNQHSSIIPLHDDPNDGLDYTRPISDLGWMNNPARAGGSIDYDRLTSFHSLFNNRQQDWDNYTVDVEYSPIENLTLNYAYNHLDQTTDEKRLADAIIAYGPNENGNPFGEEAMKWTPDGFYSNNVMKTHRVTAAYSFEVADTQHRLIGGFIDESDAFNGWAQRPYDEASNSYLGGGWSPMSQGPIPFTQADIPPNYTWDNWYWGVGWQKVSPDRSEAQGFWHWKPSSDFGGVWDWASPDVVPNNWFSPIDDVRYTQAYFGALQSEFINGKLKTLVGYRYDDYEKQNLRFDTLQDAATEDSINGGFTYQLNNNVNVYANYSETFKAAGSFRRDPYNNALTPAIGSGIEGGIKFDMPRGWSGIVTYFDTAFDNDAVQVAGVDREIIDPNGINGTNGSNWVQADSESSGFELQFVGSIARNLTVSFGIAKTDARTASDSAYQIMFNDAYFDDAQGNPTDRDGNPIFLNGQQVMKSDITINQYGKITNAGTLGLVGTGERGLFTNQVTGQATGTHNAVNGGERTSPYAGLTSNLWGRYNFTEGMLKGFFVGGSAQVRIDNYAGYTGSVANGDRTLHKRPDLYLFGLFGGFEHKFEKTTLRVQGNIENLFDKQYEYGFVTARWLQAPRTYRLSTTVSF
jgi:outer membrane receptor protein involved in Fe transport